MSCAFFGKPTAFKTFLTGYDPVFNKLGYSAFKTSVSGLPLEELIYASPSITSLNKSNNISTDFSEPGTYSINAFLNHEFLPDSDLIVMPLLFLNYSIKYLQYLIIKWLP